MFLHVSKAIDHTIILALSYFQYNFLLVNIFLTQFWTVNLLIHKPKPRRIREGQIIIKIFEGVILWVSNQVDFLNLNKNQNVLRKYEKIQEDMKSKEIFQNHGEKTESLQNWKGSKGIEESVRTRDIFYFNLKKFKTI